MSYIRDLEELVNVLADETRRAILLAFYAQPRPRTAAEVSAEVGVHRTVAFSHLERLVRAGLLSVERRRGLLGRPAKLYNLGERVVGLWYPPRRFLELAQLLAGALAQLGAAGAEAAYRAGRQWGASVGSLEAVGDRVDRQGDRLVVTNCVFQEACRGGSEVACWLHAGVLEELLAEPVRPLGPSGPGCAFRIGLALRPVPG